LANNEINVFDEIVQQLRTRIPESSTDAINNSTSRVINPRSIPKNILSNGRVYFFRYAFPKTRNELPFYHVYPCVYAINVKGHHLTGLNLFYLPPKFRGLLLNRFKEKLSGEDTFARSLFNYELMKRLKVTYATVQPAIKKYDLRRCSVSGLEISHKLWDDFYMDDLSGVLEKSFLKKNYLNIQLLSRAKIIKNLLDNGGESI
jgi:hypothetical protein